MSLNRLEQTLFSYWEKHPDELRHWQAKVAQVARDSSPPGELARSIERELWEHCVERSPHVPALRDQAGGLHRVSLLNLAEHIIRLWGSPPKPKKPASPSV
ncbi:MAG: hypothetical protein HYX71_08260 [Opitutae bacterium]|nr:hypothetical protein [Opitutae bacterium]